MAGFTTSHVVARNSMGSIHMLKTRQDISKENLQENPIFDGRIYGFL